jgi:VWFA-related protein
VERRFPAAVLVGLALSLAPGEGVPAGPQAALSGQPGPRARPVPDAELPPDPDPLVRVDAIVTDRQGRPIAGLKPSDFVLVDDGTAQTIETAQFVTRAQPAAPGRLVALFLDEFHVSATRAPHVRATMRRFVDEQLGPDDQIAILKPLESITEIRVASDHDEVREAIDSFDGRKNDYTPRTTFETNYMSSEPAAVQAARAQIVVSGLQALAHFVGELKTGRKALVVVSEGFVPAAGRERVRLPDVQAVVRTANRFDVAIYALDARDQQGVDPEDRGATLLRTLATETNGETIVKGEDLRRVARDLDAYYVLTFRPSSPLDGKFHPLKVRVKRANAEVRTRSGYRAASAAAIQARRDAAARVEPFPLGAALRLRPVRKSPLIRPWFRFSRGPGDSTRVTFMWEPVTPQVRGGRRTGPAVPQASEIEFTAATSEGTALYQGPVSPVRGSAGVGDRAIVDARPGRLELEMKIRDAAGSVIDTDLRDLEVPNLEGPRPFLGVPEVVRTLSEREFREASANPDARPAATRNFNRSERLLVRVPAFGAGGMAVTARLLNPIGKAMRDLPPLPSSPLEGVTQFDLPLGSLAPGNYSLEVTASNGTGDARELVAFRVIG